MCVCVCTSIESLDWGEDVLFQQSAKAQIFYILLGLGIHSLHALVYISLHYRK